MATANTAPSSYSNTVVIVVPTAPGAIGSSDTDVTIWYVTNSSGQPASILDATGALASTAVSVEAKMHVRGMATASLPKQQYSVKLKHEPASGNFLDMPGSGKHWVFNDCGAMDFTLVRNPLTFTAQNALGQYAPAYQYFELFLCDSTADVTTAAGMTAILASSYHGLYLNVDKIRFESSRINLPYDEDNLTSDYAIIQLNQLEASKYYAFPPPNLVLTANVQLYEPELKDLTPALESEFNAWYNGSGTNWGGTFADIYNNYNAAPATVPASTWTTVQQCTDYQSFAVYFLLNEIAKDEDGYHKSTFMVKNRAVCQAGPLWDKNKSYGNVASVGDATYTSPDNWLFQVTGQCPVWWVVLPWDPQFCSRVWDVWQQHSQPGHALSAAALTAFVNAQVATLTGSGALQRDCDRWPSAYNSPFSNYTAQVTQLNDYLTRRLAWIGANLATMLTTQSGFVPPATPAPTPASLPANNG
ncbi:hypothetical protein IGB42_03993 [Andreprevotia sp. IGB-42]|uniref:CotH kinase family protein n=1 Tax=Andreprevotia sp. IGB-42 TaxID=2497473 RepID=UPI001356E508|nr:CotH kinase family protein [Andreprevotia sp. IGB-42]KAF0811536.1 hypothetical protein IGB42_03993 [Andreprevotia sp. IGB-42]